jgi:type II secretory pathway component GspD/PulD (secretin)
MPGGLQVKSERDAAGKLKLEVRGPDASVEFQIYDYTINLMQGGVLTALSGSSDADLRFTVLRGLVSGTVPAEKGGRDDVVRPLELASSDAEAVVSAPTTAPSKEIRVSDVKKAAVMAVTSERDRISSKLKDEPAQPIRFRDAPLSQVLTTMAEAANLPYLKESTSSADSDVRINANVKMAPFAFLELVAVEHGVLLDFQNGLWIFRNYEQEGLIARTYKINFNDGERPATGGGSGGGGGGSRGASGSGSGSGSGGSLGTSRLTLSADDPPLVKELQSLVDMTSQGVVVPGDSNASTVSDKDVILPAVNQRKNTGSGANGKVADLPKSYVKWLSDARAVYVIATRQGHEWVRGYLRAVDRPQKLIAFEVKFIEMTRSPTEKIGITPPTSLGAKFNMTQNLHLFGDTTGLGSTAAATTTATGSNPNVFGVIMSPNDLQLTLNMLESDSRTENVSFMRQAVLENRSVELKNATKVPVLDTQTTTSASGGNVGSQQSASVNKEEVGTFVQLRPQIIDGNALKIDIAITVSDIIGTTAINGNNYPITAERTFTSPVIVRDGSSVAIAGLERLSVTRSNEKVPGLGDLPAVGRLFQSKTDNRTKQVLYIFITPRILSGYSGGVDSVARGDYLGRPYATRYVAGLATSVEDIRYNYEGIGRQIDEFYARFEGGQLSKEDKVAIPVLAEDVSIMADDLNQINQDRFTPEGRQLSELVRESSRRIEYLRRYLQLSAQSR